METVPRDSAQRLFYGLLLGRFWSWTWGGDIYLYIRGNPWAPNGSTNGNHFMGNILDCQLFFGERAEYQISPHIQSTLV